MNNNNNNNNILKMSITRKISLIIVIIFFTPLILFILHNYQREKNLSNDFLFEKSQSIAYEISFSVCKYLNQVQEKNIQDICEHSVKNRGINRITIINKDYLIIADTEVQNIGKYYTNTIEEKVLSGKKIHFIEIDNNKHGLLVYSISKNITCKIKNDIIILIQMELPVIKNLLSDYKNPLIVIMALSFVFFAILVFIVLNKIIITPIARLIQATDQLSSGKLNTRLEIISNDDEMAILFKSFNNMASFLEKLIFEKENENWQRNGLNSLNDIMAGKKELHIIGESILKFLCNYLNTISGVIYIWDKNQKKYIREASYSCNINNNSIFSFEFKQGILGQAAYEASPKELKNCSLNHLCFDSALTNNDRGYIYIFPLIKEDIVIGVIELASISFFYDKEKNFLNLASSSIGIFIYSILSVLETERLLLESQTMAEELETQSQMLYSTNKELEEQTQALETAQIETKNRNIELEKIKNELKRKADDLEKISSYKSEFLANMSHELRTPLNSILILSKLLEKEHNDNLSEKQKQHIKVINEAGRDLFSLISDILDLSRIEAGKIEFYMSKISLRDFIKNIEEKFVPQAKEKNLVFSAKIENNVPDIIKTDISRLGQIINNLISNALQYTQKGNISLLVTNSDKLNEKAVEFIINDTGIGIEKEKQHIIFDSFTQAQKNNLSHHSGGAGLGLAISKQLSELLGGKIILNSEPGKGSIFTLILPCNYDKNDISKINTSITLPDNKDFFNISDDRDNIKENDKILLLIEDDFNFATILMIEGRKYGYKVIVANTGMTGIDMAVKYKPKAIILDIKLPVIDGWHVIKSIKSNPFTKHIPIQIMSVIKDTHTGYSLGALNYLIKPVTHKQIEQTFEKFESISNKQESSILIVTGYDKKCEMIKEHFNSDKIIVMCVNTGNEGISELKSKNYDCIILNIDLEDISFSNVLNYINENENIKKSPIIVYSDREISDDEEDIINKFTNKIIIKTAHSTMEVIGETAIFLHNIEASLSINYDFENMNKKLTVMVVDDKIRNTYAITAALEEKGMYVISAENGKEAVDFLQKNSEVDIILMDIMMPVMNGYEAMTLIRKMEKYKNIPIIAVTAKAIKEDRKKCLDAGASDYISKPFDFNVLFSMIKVWTSQ